MHLTTLTTDVPLYGNVQIGKVVQDEVDEWLVTVLAEELDERFGRLRDAQAIGGETILSKSVVELVKNCMVTNKRFTGCDGAPGN